MTPYFFFFGSICCFSFSFLVFFKNKTSPVNKSYFYYSFCLGVWLFFWTLTFFSNHNTLILTRIILLPAYFLPVTFNMFSNGFRHHKLLSSYEKWFHTIMLTIFLSTWYSQLNIKTAELINGDLHFTFGPVYSLFGIYLLSGMGIGVFNLVIQLKNSAYKKKLQLKHCILGTIMGTLNGLFFSFVMPAFGFVTLNKFATLSSLWIVGFSFYAITKHKLMNINILISKTVSYIITAVIFFVGIIFTIYLKQEFFTNTILPNYIIIPILMLTGIIFLRVRNLIQNTTPLHLLERYNLAYFSKDIITMYVGCYDIEGVGVATKKFFTEKLGIRNCNIFINPSLIEEKNLESNILINISNQDEKLIDLSCFQNKICFVDEVDLSDIFEIKFFVEKYKTNLILNVFDTDELLFSIWLDKSKFLTLKSIDPEVFDSLSTQIGIVLDRIKPFEKVKNEFTKAKNLQMKQLKEKSVLETEYNIAKTIQERFLPKEIVNIPGFDFEYVYQPSRYVGGDYFDIHSEGKHKMGFLICDVVGKGLESSFTTIQLHSIFHSKVSPNDSPSVVMSKLNDSIYQLRTQKNHCAAFYLELNPLTKTIRYADAGNGLSYLARNGKLVELNDFGGMVLGACHDSTYTEGEITLQDNDLLFLSTDGILDFKNDNEDRFGVSRMESLILDLAKEKEKKKHIVNSITEFKDVNEPFQDDITLLTISIADKLKVSNSSPNSIFSTNLLSS